MLGSKLGGSVQELADLGVGGLGKVFVPLTDGIEVNGGPEADDLIRLLGELFADGGGGNGNGDDDCGGLPLAEGGDGRAHRRARGKAVVNEDHAFASDVGKRVIATIGFFAAFELETLAVSDFFDGVGRDVEPAGCGSGDELNSARSDGADGELGDARRAELSDNPDVQRNMKLAGDFEGYGDAPAGQGEDEHIRAVCVGGELGREAAASIESIVEVHEAPRSA
jgi:hypothetical protein